MIKILWDLEQGSNEWFELRKTRISATDAYDLLNEKPIEQILADKQADTFAGSFATERGHLLEDEARKLYADYNEVEVKQAGAIINDKFPNALCSPDGVLEEGLIEIKCFGKEHHEDAIENLDAHLVAQINFQLLISERPWVDFVSYNPEENDLDKAFNIQRIYPDEELQQKLKELLLNPTTLDSSIEKDALALCEVQNELVKLDDTLKQQLELREQLNMQIENLKDKLKRNTHGKVKKVVQLGESTLDLSIYDTHKIVVENENEVLDEYKKKVEIPDAFVENGKIYRREINTKLVNNLVKAGKSIPEGFIDKGTRNIRLKFNGKAI